MKYIPLALALSIIVHCSSVFADTVYSVISDDPKYDTGVIINNNIYLLQRSVESNILFQGAAPSNVQYSYAKLQKGTTTIVEQENFSRPAVSGSQTMNEFFNRNWNRKEVSTFEPISSISKNFNRRDDNELHPVGEIPTIHVIAAQTEIDKIHNHYKQEIEVLVNVTYISTNMVKTFSNAKFEIGGRSSRQFTKFAYNIKLNKKQDEDNLSGYQKLKLRTTVSDPSYMREYLSTEMLYAANQPATKASYVRLFINDRPIGLFTLMEKYDKNWLANEFNAGKSDYAHGILYEGQGGSKDSVRADLSYKGDNPSAYNASAYSVSEKSKLGAESLDDLTTFIKFINDQRLFQKTASAESISATVPEWEKQLDVENFLVAMAFEFLQGFWDGYLQNSNNYFLYKSPESNHFVWISWDYDYVMGSGPVNMKSLAQGDYTTYVGFDKRPLTIALLNVPEFKAMFEKNLKTIADEIYNPTKANPVIDSISNLIKDDVAWDKTLPHVRKGLEFWTFSLDNLKYGNFNNNTNQNEGVPPTLSVTTGIDFLLRLNSDIDWKKAVNGKTGHISLYGVKEWINLKYSNFYKKTSYKPLLPLPLKH
ncbi:coth protein-domain-containing protein [Parasitella parasitica]|nr:coth protein-domain-containing protein [Parasitella parasitica]